MTDNTSSNKRIAKNSIFLSIRMVIVLLVSLYTTRVVLRVLGVEDYGVLNVVGGFVALFGFLNTSMSNGIQRFFNYEYGKNGEEGARKVYSTSVYIQAILAFIVVLLVEIVGLWYLHNKMVIPKERIVAAEWVFQISLFHFVPGIMQAPFNAAIVAHERLDFYAILQILDVFLKLGLVLVLPFIPYDKLVSYALLGPLTSIVNFTLSYVYCKKKFQEIKFVFKLNRPLFREMLSFSGWNIFGSFSGVMKEQGINLVLNFFYGPIVNAARGVASQINGAIVGFVSNILIPVRPQVTQSYAKGDIFRSLNLTYSISKLATCFLFLMAIPVSLEIDFILKLWLGENVPAHTSTFTILVFMNSLLSILNGAISTLVHATGIMKKYQLWSSFWGIMSVPFAFLVMKIYAVPELAMIVSLVCFIISHIICLFIVRDLVGLQIKEYLNIVIIPITIVFIVTLLFSLPLRIFFEEGWLRFIVVVFVSIVVTSLSSFFLAFSESERNLVKQMVRSVFTMVRKPHNNIRR